MVRIDGRAYSAHRILWLLIGNVLPPPHMHIDHINGDPNDNRIKNLRIATAQQNSSNWVSRKRGKYGLKGITPVKRGWWHARLNVDRKVVFMDDFRTKGLAAVAYAKASLKYQGKFSPFYRKAA